MDKLRLTVIVAKTDEKYGTHFTNKYKVSNESEKASNAKGKVSNASEKVGNAKGKVSNAFDNYECNIDCHPATE